MTPGLVLMDDDGTQIVLDPAEARELLTVTGGFDAATVSACPDCGSRVLAAVALVDLLDEAPPHPRTGELIEFADEAPTLHVYVVDDAAECEHPRWIDPLYDEWIEVVEAEGPRARP